MRVKIFVIRIDGDDPKKSTALKLVRLGLAIKVSRLGAVPKNAVVLDPLAKLALSPADRTYVLEGGVAVVDTSWNLGVEALSRIFGRIRGQHRVLPLLFAGNPINYAVPTKLSSAEAVAAALYITGFKEEAEEVMSKFKWGHTFLELNEELLDAYSRASGPDEVLKIQEGILKKFRESRGRPRC